MALREAGPGEGRQEGVGGTAARLYEGLGQVLRLTGQHKEARKTLDRALGEIEADDWLSGSRILVQIGLTCWAQGQLDQALDNYDEAHRRLGSEPAMPEDTWWQQRLLVEHGRLYVHYSLGQWQEAEATVDRALPVAEQHGTPIQRTWFTGAIIGIAMRRDRYVISDETLAKAQVAKAEYEESGDLFLFALCQLMLGWCYLLRGELDGAEREVQATLTLAERTGDVQNRIYALTWLTFVRRMRGQVDAARDYAARTLEAATTAWMPEQIAAAQANQAWVAWRDGNQAEAEDLGQSALRLWQRSQWAYAFQWTALWPLLVVALEKEQVPEALHHARALLDPQQQRMPADLEDALESACQLGDAGQPERVRVQLERTVELAQELGYL